jgi:hypothetical protein
MEHSQMTTIRDSIFADLFASAHAAGVAAGRACRPIPMVVTDGVSREVIDDGMCGFGWVIVKPANSPLGNWAKKTLKAGNAYGGGRYLTWCHEFGQSFERKSAYAGAFAEVFRAAGYTGVTGHSRID